MRSLSKKIVLFLIPLLVVWGILWSYFSFYGNENHYSIFASDEAWEQAPDSFDYLIAGHSRPFRAIETDSLAESIKIGTPGESYLETYYKLTYLLEKDKKHFTHLILPFEKGTFKPNDFRRRVYWSQYLDFWEIGRLRGQKNLYLQEYIMAKSFPFTAYFRQHYQGFIYRKSPSSNPHISINKNTDRFDLLSEEMQSKLIQKDIHILAQNGLLDELAFEFLERTLRLTEKHNIQVIYLKCPLTESYSASLDSLAIVQKYPESDLEVLVEGYKHVRILDFEKLFFGRDEWFSDHHHLNAIGRAKFSSVFCRDVALQRLR